TRRKITTRSKDSQRAKTAKRRDGETEGQRDRGTGRRIFPPSIRLSVCSDFPGIRMNSRFPFSPYPSGWFRVGVSRDIKPGQIKPLRYFGRDLALFRAEDGAARVLEAHCPHLGAHLGHGGRVIGDSVQCPFHGWRWNGEGQCETIPYSQKIPPNATLRRWPVKEVNGLIMV